MAVLDDFHTRCSVDEDSAEVAPGAITPQMRSMAVVVECDGRTMLIGTQVTEPSYGTDESSDFVIEPHFLPGGERDGELKSGSIDVAGESICVECSGDNIPPRPIAIPCPCP